MAVNSRNRPINAEELIELVRAQPHIWDKKETLYKDVNFKESTWQGIAFELSSTVLECKTRWRSLRDKYRREMNYDSLPSGSGINSRKPWHLMSSMQFLNESSESATTISNIDLTTEADTEGSSQGTTISAEKLFHHRTEIVFI